MISQEQRATLTAFMGGHPTAVIATADTSGQPAAAVILFAHDENLNIIFGSHQSRKHANIMANPRAALVLTKDWSEIQLHGSVSLLSGTESDQAKKLFLAKHPEMDQHMVAGSDYFRLQPSWIRYMDTSKHPPEQWEVTL